MVNKLISSPELHVMLFFAIIAGLLIDTEYLIAKGALEDEIPILAKILYIALLPVSVVAFIFIFIRGF